MSMSAQPQQLNLSAGFRNIPFATRSILIAVVTLFLFHKVSELTLPQSSTSEDGGITKPDLAAAYRSSYARFFTVSVESIWWPWTYVTAGLFERNVVELVVNGGAFLVFGKYLEHAWSSREFVKFAVLVNLSTYLLVATALFIEYALTLNIKFLYTTANGLSGLLFGFLVAFKQMVPEHTVSVFKIVSVRVKYIPSLAIGAYIILFLVGLINAQLFIILSGTLTSWVYIRFFKQQDGIRGDRSETFSFASFFPEILHPFIAPVSNATFQLFVALRLLPPLAVPVLPTTSAAMSSTIYGDLNKSQNLLGSDTADAERRRALALRALDKRLAQNTSSPAVVPPQNASNSPEMAVQSTT